MMTIGNLSNDLESEILARVPAKSLQQLKTTCKRWYALFKNPRFVEKNKKTSKPERESMLLSNHQVYSIPGDLHVIYNSGVEEQTIDFTGKLTSLKNSEDLDLDAIYHCDGLMLCQTKDNHRLLVWNPCTGQRKSIKPRTCYGIDDIFALGYSSITSSPRHCSYKILRYCYHENYENELVAEFEIYDLSSDSWRVFDSFILDYGLFSRCISLRGDSYWIAGNESGFFLIKFDFTAERFVRLPLPFEDDAFGDTVLLSVVRDEKLAVLLSDTLLGPNVMRIWITNKIDDKEEAKDLSWRTDFVFEVASPELNVSVENFLLDEENKVAVCCGNKYGYVTMMYIVGENMYRQVYEETTDVYPNWPRVITYVPSLVRIH